MTPATILALQSSVGNRAVSRALARDQYAGDSDPAAQRELIEAGMSSPSYALAGPMRAELESYYQNDFSAARIHDNPIAQRAAARKEVIGHEFGHVNENLKGVIETGSDNMAATDRFVKQSAEIGTENRIAAESAPVQRVLRRSGRNIDPRAPSDPRGRTRGSERSMAQNPLDRARQALPPVVGQEGEPLWTGRREGIEFKAETIKQVLEVTSSQVDEEGRLRYKCGFSHEDNDNWVLSKTDARAARENNWYEIDHLRGLLAYVHEKVTPKRWDVELSDGIYRKAEGIILEDAKAAANDPGNLRTLCRVCNGKRASRSKSHDIDQSGATWVGGPWERDRSASPGQGRT